MSTRYVIDSWAWVEYLDGTETGKEVAARIKDHEIFTNSVTITEVISKAKRKKQDVDGIFNAITSLSKIIDVDAESAKNVGILHSTIKERTPNFSFGDAFTLYTAKSLSAKVLTGDPDFKNIKEAEILEH
jgi:PIN domain nuclease of toxin-antitoxin system